MNVTVIDLDTEAANILDVLAAGVAARLYVRGALDPLFSDPAARDTYAKALAKSSPTLAAEFIRGWCEHHETVPEPVIWHRWLGGMAWEVSA